MNHIVDPVFDLVMLSLWLIVHDEGDSLRVESIARVCVDGHDGIVEAVGGQGMYRKFHTHFGMQCQLRCLIRLVSEEWDCDNWDAEVGCFVGGIQTTVTHKHLHLGMRK